MKKSVSSYCQPFIYLNQLEAHIRHLSNKKSKESKKPVDAYVVSVSCWNM